MFLHASSHYLKSKDSMERKESCEAKGPHRWSFGNLCEPEFKKVSLSYTSPNSSFESVVRFGTEWNILELSY